MNFIPLVLDIVSGNDKPKSVIGPKAWLEENAWIYTMVIILTFTVIIGICCGIYLYYEFSKKENSNKNEQKDGDLP